MTGHLSQEQLLRYLDGETSKLVERKAASHLQACWSCQAELGRLKEQIAGILDAQRSLFEPSLPPPPAPWPRLEARLEQVKIGKQPPVWKRFLPFLALSLRPQVAFGSMAVVAAIISLSVWVSVTPASAQEVLRRATAADARRFSITKQQAVRQRVRIRKTARLESAVQASSLEAWRSTGSSLWRSAGDPINADLQARYAANGLSSALPLSPAAVETWVRLAGSEPKASRDGDVITVEATAGAQGRTGMLEKVSLRVQSEAWHLDELTLSFTDATFQITEEESSVLARSEVPADVLARLEPAPERQPPAAANSPIQEPTDVVNLDDLEMAVLYDLRSLGADLGEGVEVIVHPPDAVIVDARQASQETKDRLLAALGDRPGVKLDLRPPGSTVSPQRSVTKRLPVTEAQPAPMDQRLVAYFGSAEAQENFTRSALEASNRILTRFHAVRDLAGRWSPEQESRLKAISKSRLDSMLRDHSREILLATAELDEVLATLMKGFRISTRGGLPPPGGGSGARWQDASASGLEAAQRVDRLIRALLTVSDTPVSPDSALPQLQAGLRDLESSARRLPATE